MLTFRGASALSPFRLQRLLASERRIEPGLSAIAVEFVHFVDVARLLDAGELALLARLLGDDPEAPRAGGAPPTLVTVPRPGTVSPWSTKATDIARVCGLDAVRRIERGKAWRLELAGVPDALRLAALAAPLYDRMTESVLGSLAEG